MQVHIFRGPGRIFAFTAQQSGEMLPKKYAPWTAFKAIDLHKGESTPGVNADECLNDIEAFGVHVTDAHVRILPADINCETRHFRPWSRSRIASVHFELT
jgi:hypothetical protein